MPANGTSYLQAFVVLTFTYTATIVVKLPVIMGIQMPETRWYLLCYVF